MENALTANNNKIDAVVASNDATAGGAIQALSARGLAGKVAISGRCRPRRREAHYRWHSDDDRLQTDR